jgi:hypothetical protein
VAFDEYFLPHGVDPVHRYAEARQISQPNEFEENPPADWDEFHNDLRWEEFRNAPWPTYCDWKAYQAVQAGAEDLIRLLDSDDAALRTASAYALAHFPAVAAEAAPAIRAALARDADPLQRANLVLCLGMLGRYLQDPSDAGPIAANLTADQPEVLRLAAAIALGTLLGAALPAAAVEVLLQAVVNASEPVVGAEVLPDSLERWGNVPDQGPASYEGLRWNEGDLVGYASLMLSDIGPGQVDRILPVLCQAIQRTHPGPGFKMAYALLDLVFPRNDCDPSGPLDRLNRHQQQALQALLHSSHYRGWMGVRYGLPHDEQQLAQLLEVTNSACDPCP